MIFSVLVLADNTKFLARVKNHTDEIGGSIIKQLIKVNKKLDRYMTSGYRRLYKTVELMKESQPLRYKLSVRIKDIQCRTIYEKIIKNVNDFLKLEPLGEPGQASLITSLQTAITIFSS